MLEEACPNSNIIQHGGSPGPGPRSVLNRWRGNARLVCGGLAELAIGPDPIAPLKEEEGGWQEEHANTSKDCATPIYANLFIHGPDKEWEGSCRH